MSDTSIDLIKKIISYDTTSRNSNLELIHFIRDYLQDIGVESLLVHDDTGTKANLYATLGPADRPGILLSDTDVVPIDGQDWHTDPFNVVEKDATLRPRHLRHEELCRDLPRYAPKFLDGV